MLPVFLLAIVLAGVGFGVWNQVQFQGQLGMSVVDPREERVILVFTSTTEPANVRQLAFADINAVELHYSGSMQGASQEVILIAGDDSIIIEKSRDNHSLLPSAETLSHQIGAGKVKVVGEVGEGGAIQGAF